MCGRFQWNHVESFKTMFGFPPPENWKAEKNLAPQTQIYALFQAQTPGRKATWGINCGRLVINARSETVLQKQLFQRAFWGQRVVIPSSGYYEWASTKEGKKPFLISPEKNELLPLAGFFHPEKQGLLILTRESVPALKACHSRMPLCLTKESIQTWLSPNTPKETLLKLLHQPPKQKFSLRQENPLEEENKKKQALQPSLFDFATKKGS